MPLRTAADLNSSEREILKKFNVKVDDTTPIGTVLRRACVLPITLFDSDKPRITQVEWMEFISVIQNITHELDLLEDSAIASERELYAQLSLKNKQYGKSALDFILHSFLLFAKSHHASNDMHIYYFLYLTYSLARHLNAEHLTLASLHPDIHKLLTHTKPYQEKIENLFIDAADLQKAGKIPTIDLCIEAIKYMFATLSNCRTTQKQTIAKLMSYKVKSAPKPVLVLLTAHDDHEVAKFLQKNLSHMAKQGYGLLTMELPQHISIQDYCNQKAVFKVGSDVLMFSPHATKKVSIFKSIIEAAQNEKVAIEFVDTSADMPEIGGALFNILQGKYNYYNMLQESRDRAMAYNILLASSEQGTGAIHLTGLNHYKTLKAFAGNMGFEVEFKFVLLTGNFAKLKDQAKVLGSLLPMDPLPTDVTLLDLSKQGDWKQQIFPEKGKLSCSLKV